MKVDIFEDIANVIDRKSGYTSDQLAAFVRDKINSNELEAGVRFPATSELTKLFGVSTHTIQRAMGILDTEGLIQGAPGKGRFVSKLHGGSKANLKQVTQIGVMNAFSFEGGSFPNDELRIVSVRGVLCEASNRHINTVIMPYGLAEAKPQDIQDSLSAFKAGGVIWLYPSSSHWAVIEKLEENNIPVVVTSRSHFGYNIACVEGDYEDGGYAIGRHFIESGSKEVIVIPCRKRMDATLSQYPESMDPSSIIQGITKALNLTPSDHTPEFSSYPIDSAGDDFTGFILNKLKTLKENDGVVFLNSFHLYDTLKKHTKETLELLSKLNVVLVANEHLISKFSPYQGRFDMYILQDPLLEIAKMAVQKLSSLISGSLYRTKTLVKADLLRFSEIDNFN